MSPILELLVSHGPLVWKAALSLFVVSGMAWQLDRPLRRARRAARRVASEATPLEHFVEGKEVVVEGVLDGRGRTFDDALATTVRWSRLQDPEHERARGLLLRIDGEPIVLEGPVEVLLGSRHEHGLQLDDPVKGSHLRRALGQGRIRRMMRRPRLALASVDSGARARVQGTLRRVADERADKGYREAGGKWVLVGTRRRPLRVASQTPPAVRDHARPLRVVTGMVMGLGVFSALFLGGGALVHHARSSGIGVGTSKTAGHDDEVLAAVAAAMPLQRRQALRSLARIRFERGEDPERLAPMVRETDGCTGEVRMWSAYGRPDKVIEVDCLTALGRATTASAHFLQGDLRVAADLYDSSWIDDEMLTTSVFGARRPSRAPATRYRLRAATSHFAEGRWRRGARFLDGMFGGRTLRCVADAARGRDGDPVDGLRDEGSPICRILEADLAPSHDRLPERSQLLRHLPLDRRLSTSNIASDRTRAEREQKSAQRLAVLLAYELYDWSETSTRLPPPPQRHCPLDPDGAPALEHAALDALRLRDSDEESQRILRAQLGMRRALFETLAFRDDEAEGWLADASEAIEGAGLPELDQELARTRRIIEAWRNGLPQTDGFPPIDETTDFRNRLCESAARARVALRTPDRGEAVRQRATAGRFANYLRDRQTSLLYWALSTAQPQIQPER